jgi:hypothetical protein
VLAAEDLVVASQHRLRYLLLRLGVDDTNYAAGKRGREVVDEAAHE